MDSTETRLTREEILAKPYRDMNDAEVAIAVEANKKILEERFDMELMRNMAEELAYYLRYYYRPRYVGFEEMEERNEHGGPLIYAMNHSGMAFPWDAIVFGAGLYQMHDYDLYKLMRALAAPALSATPIMNPYMIPDLWRRLGGIDAYGLNFETMMHQKETNVLIYPEGVPGIGKGFENKYQLQTFSTSFVRMAIKYETDIIWISCINGEYINPYAYKSKFLNRIANLLGIPFIPLSFILILLILQPWMFYMGFPARLVFVKGKRYKPYEMTGGKSWSELSLEDFKRIRDEIQAGAQASIDEGVKHYGKHPWHLKSLFGNIRRYWRSLPYWLPFGWPALFLEYERIYRKTGKFPKDVTKGRFRFFRIIWKNPILIAYFTPIIGWIPILWLGTRNRQKVKHWKPSS